MSEPIPSKGTILLVDDHPSKLEALTALVIERGHRVRSTVSGELALQTARTLSPDLILLGIHAADMDTYETCRRLKADDTTCGIPVLFVEPQDKARAFAAGGADCVTLPVQKAEVLARVATHLELREMREKFETKDTRQNEFLTTILESLTHPFYVVDAHDYTIQLANPAAQMHSLLGQATCYALTHGRTSPCKTASHPCPLEEIKRTKKPVTVEHVHFDRDGNSRNVEVHGYPLFDSEGNVVQIIEYTLDITQRRQAEAALRENEENWRSLTEYSPDHIMLLDREANILFINHTLPELSKVQVLDTSFYDYALPEYRGVAQACFEGVLETGQPDRFESVYVDAQGHRQVFESHVGPVMRSGRVWGLVVRSTEITASRQAQEALQTLTHDMGERVKELNCLYGVSRLAGSQGITLKEIFQGAVELIPPSWLHPEVTSARITLEGQEFKTKHFRETEWRQASDIVVHGERAGTLEVCLLEERSPRDEGPFLKEERYLIDAIAERLGRIIERTRALEALRESEARWRSLTENSPDHVLLLDADLCIEFANYASPGLTAEELIGTPLYSYVPEAQQSEIRGILEKVLRTGEPTSYETDYGTPDGSTIYYESRVVPRTLGEETVGLALNARDISEHRQTEAALRYVKEAAEAARREEQERRKDAERRRQIAESLADVLAALNSNQPLKQILEYIALQARKLLGNKAVAIYRLTGEAGTLALQAAQGLPTECALGEEGHEGRGALQRAVALRQPVAVPHLSAAPPDLAPEADGLAVADPCAGLCQALLAVPIAVGDEVYGAILLHYAEPQTFSDEEVELAGVFGNQVALAIENARLREQVEQTATIAERGRLARDLHDSVTQALFSATLVAEVLPQVWRRDPEEALEGVEELRYLTRSALAEMRTMLLELRPTALLETRLEDLLRQLTEAVTSRAQLQVVLNLDPVPTLTPDVHLTFYRVAQEALHNTVKHAEASQVTVSLRTAPPGTLQQGGDWQGQVILQVSDDGRGCDPARTGPDQMGLRIMRERAEAAGAMLDVESQPGQGTQVTLVWMST